MTIKLNLLKSGTKICFYLVLATFYRINVTEDSTLLRSPRAVT